MLIDSHAHLSSDPLFEKIEHYMERAKLASVDTIINICTDRQSLERGLMLAKKYPNFHNAAATHPHDVAEKGEEEFEVMEKAAKAGHLIAIGETGLDYFYSHSPKESQALFLRRYMQLALRVKLPLIIHCREAFSDFFPLLDAEYQVSGRYGPGVLHCFTGTIKEAEEVLKRDWFISISGIVTFKKSTELQTIVKEIPLERLLIETDAPFLAPQSYRGKTNEPAFVGEVAKKIAEIKQLSFEKVIEVINNNTKKLFKIS